MSDLTHETERLVLDWLTGKTVVQPVAPLVVRLMGASGDADTPGTEVTGDLYVEQEASLPAAATAAGVTSSGNDTPVTFPGIDATVAVDVYGVEVWDSGTTPRRLAFKDYGVTPVTVPAGETAVLDVDTLVLEIP